MRKLFILCGFVLLLLPLTVAAQEEATEEVSDAHRAQSYALEHQIMYPDGDGEFRGEGLVNRLEFTLAVVDYLYGDEEFEECYGNITSPATNQFRLLFRDVEADSWFGKRLCVAMRAGLINGDNQGNFRPFASITRAEASKILGRAYGLVYPSLHPSGKPWYWAGMVAMENRGAFPVGSDPTTLTTRDEMAMMFYALRNQERFPERRIIGSTQQSRVALLNIQSAADRASITISCFTSSPHKSECKSNVELNAQQFQRMSRRLIRQRAREHRGR